MRGEGEVWDTEGDSIDVSNSYEVTMAVPLPKLNAEHSELGIVGCFSRGLFQKRGRIKIQSNKPSAAVLLVNVDILILTN